MAGSVVGGSPSYDTNTENKSSKQASQQAVTRWHKRQLHSFLFRQENCSKLLSIHFISTWLTFSCYMYICSNSGCEQSFSNQVIWFLRHRNGLVTYKWLIKTIHEGFTDGTNGGAQVWGQRFDSRTHGKAGIAVWACNLSSGRNVA